MNVRVRCAVVDLDPIGLSGMYLHRKTDRTALSSSGRCEYYRDWARDEPMLVSIVVIKEIARVRDTPQECSTRATSSKRFPCLCS